MMLATINLDITSTLRGRQTEIHSKPSNFGSMTKKLKTDAYLGSFFPPSNSS